MFKPYSKERSSWTNLAFPTIPAIIPEKTNIRKVFCNSQELIKQAPINSPDEILLKTDFLRRDHISSNH